MDLKDFITETISSILEAVSDLQEKYETTDHLIAPAVYSSKNRTVMPNETLNTARTIEDIAFNVAVSVTSESSAGAKAGIKVISVEIGGGGETSAGHESVSRVQFNVPIALGTASDLVTLVDERNARRRGQAE